MGLLIDQAISLRVIYMLVTPLDKWDAFKFGIIDKNGKILKKASTLKTLAEKESFTMLHRLVLRLKNMLAILPGGRSMFASFAAAYMLVKEHSDMDPDTALQLFAEHLNHIDEYGLDDELAEEFRSLLVELKGQDIEEEIANVTAGIEPTVPRIKPKKIKVKKISGAVSRKMITPSINESIIYIDTSTNQFFIVD